MSLIQVPINTVRWEMIDLKATEIAFDQGLFFRLLASLLLKMETTLR